MCVSNKQHYVSLGGCIVALGLTDRVSEFKYFFAQCTILWLKVNDFKSSLL